MERRSMNEFLQVLYAVKGDSITLLNTHVKILSQFNEKTTLKFVKNLTA